MGMPRPARVRSALRRKPTELPHQVKMAPFAFRPGGVMPIDT